MKKLTLNVWFARLIFCLCVILLYHVIGNVGIILKFISRIFDMLTPFIIGGVIAFLFFPFCRKLEIFLARLNLPFLQKRVRLTATLIVLILILFIIFALCYTLFKVVPLIYDGLLILATTFSKNFNIMCDSYSVKFRGVAGLEQLIETIRTYATSDNLIQWVSMLNYNSYVGKIASFVGYIFKFFIGVIVSIYILLERAVLKKTFFRISNLVFSRRNVLQLRRTLARIAQILYAFIFGQIVDELFVAYVMGLVFSLFKISNGLSLAVLYFLFALIPYFGSTIGVFLITFLSMVLSSKQYVFVFIIAFVFQQVDANLINPRIVGKAVGLGPFSVLLGIVLFGGLFGVYGFFLGTPLMAICLELADDFCRVCERKKLKNKQQLS